MRLELVKDLAGAHSRTVSAVKIVQDTIYTVGADGCCKKWDAQFRDQTVFTGEKGLSDVAVSEDGAVAVASDDTNVYLVRNGKTHTLVGHEDYVFAVAFGGSLLASVSYDQSYCLWNAHTGELVKRWPCAHAEPVTSVAFSPDATLLATGSYDGLVRLWDVKTQRCVRTLADDEIAPVGHVTFAPNGKFLFVATLDGRIRLWSIQSPPSVAKTYAGRVPSRYCTPCRLFVHPESKEVYAVSGSEDGHVRFWSSSTRQCIVDETVGSAAAVIGCDVHGDLLAVSTLSEGQGSVRVYRVRIN